MLTLQFGTPRPGEREALNLNDDQGGDEMYTQTYSYM